MNSEIPRMNSNSKMRIVIVIMYSVYAFVCLTSRLELVMEDRIDYNDLTEMMLYDSTHIELIRKALDTDNKGTRHFIL